MAEVDINDLDVGLDGEAPVNGLNGAPYSGRVNEIRSGALASTFAVVEGYKDGEELLFKLR